MTKFSKYTKQELIQICKKRKWVGYSKYTKVPLVKFMTRRNTKENKAAKIIQKTFKRWFQQWKIHAKVINENDVFSLESLAIIPQERIFKIRAPKLSIYQFDCQSLLNYMISTGNFSNPFTRENLTDQELKRILNQYLRCCPNQPLTYSLEGKSHTVNCFSNLSLLRSQIKKERTELDNLRQLQLQLQSSATNVINLILDSIVDIPTNDSTVVTNVVQSWFLYFPALQDDLLNLRDIDEHECKDYLVIVVHDVCRDFLEFKRNRDAPRSGLMYVFIMKLINIYYHLFGVTISSPLIREVQFEHRSI